jgi:hypothetical protein
VIEVTGLFGDSQETVVVQWDNGEVYARSDVRAALELAALEPVVLVPEVLEDPLVSPLGFVGVCERVLRHLEVAGLEDEDAGEGGELSDR